MSSASDVSALADAAGASAASATTDNTGGTDQSWWQDHQSSTSDASSSGVASSPSWAASSPTSTAASSTSGSSGSSGGTSTEAAWWADHQSGSSGSAAPSTSTQSGLSGSTTFSNPAVTTSSDSGNPDHSWWQDQASSASSDPGHSTADSINSQIAGSENGWPVNANGEYLVIDVTIVPNANVDLTTIFNLNAESHGLGQAVTYDLVSQQLSHISENTYVDINYYWDSKPGLIVNTEPLFNVDNDIFTAVNYNPNDVTLNTALDITQVAVPTSDAGVTVTFDPNDSNHDGVYFNVNVDTALTVAVDQALNAYVDALQHA